METIKEQNRLRKISEKYKSMFEIFEEQLQEIARRENVKIFSCFQIVISSGFKELSEDLLVGQAVAAGKFSKSDNLSEIVSMAAYETFEKEIAKRRKEYILQLHKRNQSEA